MSHADAWFPCYVNDLLGSMRWKMMTPEQRGGYWQLICWQMQSDDGHLIDDLVALSKLADIDLSKHAAVIDSFPVDSTGKRANVRAFKEWQKRKAISGVRSEAGSKGMAKRYQTVNKRSNKPLTSVTTSTSTSTEEHLHPQSGGARAADYSTLSGCVEAIISARTGQPDSEKYRPARVTVENYVKSLKPEDMARTVREFCESVASMIDPPKDPIGLLRGYVRKSAEKKGTDSKSTLANVYHQEKNSRRESF